MLVYNISDRDIDYRGHLILANGGSKDIQDLTFIPDRDRRHPYLSFGSLPSGWSPPAPPAVDEPPQVKVIVKEIVRELDIAEDVKVETKQVLKESVKKKL